MTDRVSYPPRVLIDDATNKIVGMRNQADVPVTFDADMIPAADLTAAQVPALQALVSGAGNRLASAVRAYKAGLRTRPPIVFGLGDSNFTGEGAGSVVGSYAIGDAFKNSPIQQIRACAPQINGLNVENSAIFGDGNSGIYAGLTLSAYDPRITVGTGWARESTPGMIGGRFFVAPSGSAGYLEFNFGRALDTIEIHFPVTTGLADSVGVYASDNTLIGTYSCSGTKALGVPLTITSAKLSTGIVKFKNNAASGTAYLSGCIGWNSARQEIIIAQGSWAGASASNYANLTDPWGGCGHLDSIKPDALICALTINDISSGTIPGDYYNYMVTIISKQALYGAIILSTGQPCDETPWTATLAARTIERAMITVAGVYRGNTISMHDEFVSWAAANTQGLVYNAKHGTAAGYLKQANVFARMLLSLA